MISKAFIEDFWNLVIESKYNVKIEPFFALPQQGIFKSMDFVEPPKVSLYSFRVPYEFLDLFYEQPRKDKKWFFSFMLSLTSL